MSAMTISQRLVDWQAGLATGAIPEDRLADGRRRLLDTLGVILVGSRQPLGESVLTAARRLGRGDEARCLPSGERLPAASAALVHGTLAHATDFDDTHNATLLHPSGPVVAAALAMAEACQRDGRDLLEAIVIGNEIGCRLAMIAPLAFHRQGQHPTGILAPAMTAVVAGRLLGLGAEALVHAVGIAGSQASGILESFADGTWVKTLHPGWGAHAGIVAALLAQAGFTGPASVIEGRFGLFRSHLADPGGIDRFDRAVEGLGEHWDSRDNSFKPYACAHVIHPFVDLALQARQEGLTADRIDSVEMVLNPRYIPVVAEPRDAKLAPRTPTHARASLPYCVAAAWVLGHLDVDAFDPPNIDNPAILALAGRLHVVADTEPLAPGQFRGVLAIREHGGRSTRRSQPHNRGGFDSPLSDDELIAKFNANTRGVLAGKQRQAVIDQCLQLERQTSLDGLLQACVAAD